MCVTAMVGVGDCAMMCVFVIVPWCVCVIVPWGGGVFVCV